MDLSTLKSKAAALPAEPGVYLMRDKDGTVIYVGKAKKLKNRVSQYFQDTTSHSPKTRLMVNKIEQFDVIVAASEFEALVLECSLIKRHKPKYNILLKDDKGYPYLRINMKDIYPSISMVGKIADDGAEYFGPYGSRGVTSSLLQSLNQSLKLPDCSKRFPRDIGKGRVCLNYHMNQCDGWCQEGRENEEYRNRIEQARQLLLGNYKQVAGAIRKDMHQAADEMNFELAASLRDRLRSVEALGQKQLVTAADGVDTDVIGYCQNDNRCCFAVLHYSGGNLLDKDYEILPAADDKEAALSSLVKQYYLSRGFAPRVILLPFSIEDAELCSKLFAEQFGTSAKLHTPVRGDNAHLVARAVKNAEEELGRVTTRDERHMGAVHLLSKMLMLPTLHRIESFDVSHISGTDIVAGMTVFVDGRPHKSDYRKFCINGFADQDDYGAMEQVVLRRFAHYLNGDSGFALLPDVLLIDGGAAHARVAVNALNSLSLEVPVFGMVKNDKHRTRALISADGTEIGIDTQQSVFSLVGNIQEETHRFAITYHRSRRRKRLQHSQLDGIPGIGPKRKQVLLKAFKSISAIRQASLAELERFLPKLVAYAVYEHFAENKKG